MYYVQSQIFINLEKSTKVVIVALGSSMGWVFYLEVVLCSICLTSQFGEEYAYGEFEVVYELIKEIIYMNNPTFHPYLAIIWNKPNFGGCHLVLVPSDW